MRRFPAGMGRGWWSAHSHGPQTQRMQVLTLVLLARVDGPAREGIQNQPSVSSPSFATLDNALHSKDVKAGILQCRCMA